MAEDRKHIYLTKDTYLKLRAFRERLIGNRDAHVTFSQAIEELLERDRVPPANPSEEPLDSL